MNRLHSSVFGICLVLFVAASTPVFSLYAAENSLFYRADERRHRETGLKLLVPKRWLMEDDSRVTLGGADVKHIRIYPFSDQGNRTSTALDISVSTIKGIFDVPERLRPKLTDANLLNWHIDRLERSENAFKVRTVRKETWLGFPMLVLEYSFKTHDKYDAYVVEHFLFNGDTVYEFDSWFLSHRPESKTLLDAIRREIRFLTDAEKRLTR